MIFCGRTCFAFVLPGTSTEHHNSAVMF